jgi:hypothetical protein
MNFATSNQPRAALGSQPPTYKYESTRASGSGADVNTAQAFAAFQQNASLPPFSAAAIASRNPPLPIYHTQHELPAWQSHRPSTIHAGGIPGLMSTNLISKQDPYGQPLRKPFAPSISNTYAQRISQQHNMARDNVEEGELSEGEFEEKPSTSWTKSGEAYIPPRTNSRTTSVYDRSQDFSPQGRVHAGLLQTQTFNDVYEGEKSQFTNLASCSFSADHAYDHGDDQYEPALALAEDDDSYSPTASPILAHAVAPLQAPHNPQYFTKVVSTPPTASPSRYSPVADKSPTEILKLAENAVLNLMPAKVRFQDYLDEGIDESLMRRLYENLRLPQAPPKTADLQDSTALSPSAKADKPSDTLAAPQNNTVHPPVANSPKDLPTDQSSSAEMGNLHLKSTETSILPQSIPSKGAQITNVSSQSKPEKAEERKDRIARLMAEKANKKGVKPTLPPIQPVPNPPTQGTSYIKPDKERLLRLKMEALQKSREARALKNATQPAAAASATPSDGLSPHVGDSTPTILHPESSGEQAEYIASSHPFATTVNAQVAPVQPSISAIPGLFLANTSNPASPSLLASNLEQSSNIRKRPVASDFDDISLTSTTYKRPFGQSRQDQRLVIDVSEDESADEEAAMEIDETTDEGFSPSTPDLAVEPRRGNIGDQPPLSDIPVKKPLSRTASSFGTPSFRDMGGKALGTDHLKSKEQEILEMRKKIETLEARKKLKKSRSGSQTPLATEQPKAVTIKEATTIAEKVEASAAIERLINDASRQVNADEQKLAEAQAVETEKAAQVQREEAKRRRRAELESGIPAVDAEVEENQRKLAELQALVAQHLAAIERGKEEKRRLAEEMAKLGRDMDAEVQANRDELEDLKKSATISETSKSQT